MVRVPTPEDEDRHRISRERNVLIAERVAHVNRTKGLLFSQGIIIRYEPLSRDRRARLEELRTGDGRVLPEHRSARALYISATAELTLRTAVAVILFTALSTSAAQADEAIKPGKWAFSAVMPADSDEVAR
jgi:transposase